MEKRKKDYNRSERIISIFDTDIEIDINLYLHKNLFDCAFAIFAFCFLFLLRYRGKQIVLT